MDDVTCRNCGEAVRVPPSRHEVRDILRDGDPPQYLILADSAIGTSLLHQCDVDPPFLA